MHCVCSKHVERQESAKKYSTFISNATLNQFDTLFQDSTRSADDGRLESLKKVEYIQVEKKEVKSNSRYIEFSVAKREGKIGVDKDYNGKVCHFHDEYRAFDDRILGEAKEVRISKF